MTKNIINLVCSLLNLKTQGNIPIPKCAYAEGHWVEALEVHYRRIESKYRSKRPNQGVANLRLEDPRLGFHHFLRRAPLLRLSPVSTFPRIVELGRNIAPDTLVRLG